MMETRNLLPVLIALVTGACATQSQKPFDMASVELVLTQEDIDNLPFVKLCKKPVLSPIAVSVTELLNNPSRYEARPVTLDGYYLQHGFYSAIFSDLKGFDEGMFDQSIWIDTPLGDSINGKRITVSGIFSTTIKGGYGAFKSGICNVTAVSDA